MKQTHQLRQRGFSLLELGLVLSAIAIAATLGFTQLSEGQDSNRAQTMSRDLSRIIAGVQQLYANQATFPAGMINNQIFINNGILPSTWRINANGVVRTQFGGEFSIGTQDWSGGSVAAIVLTNVPPRVCTELGQTMSGILGLSVNFRNVKSPRFATSVLDPGTLGEECANIPENRAGPTMAFFFDRGR